MKNKLFFAFVNLIFFLSIGNTAIAQEVRSPLDDKEVETVIPASPGENWTWVKAHWSWDGARYKWKRGMYIEIRKGYIWVDGKWERNQKTGWWKFNEGYWQKEGEGSDVKNDANTLEIDKESKEKRQENKAGSLYIKTGSSK